MFNMFLGKEINMYGVKGYSGSIKIDDFEEFYFSNKTFFSKTDYYRSWILTLERFFSINDSYFLIDVYEPKNANFFRAWMIYNIEGIIYAQENVMFKEEYSLNEVLNLKVSLENIKFVNEDGIKISTWKTDMASMYEFNKKLRKKYII